MERDDAKTAQADALGAFQEKEQRHQAAANRRTELLAAAKANPEVLSDPELGPLWQRDMEATEAELGQMRAAMDTLRSRLPPGRDGRYATPTEFQMPTVQESAERARSGEEMIDAARKIKPGGLLSLKTAQGVLAARGLREKAAAERNAAAAKEQQAAQVKAAQAEANGETFFAFASLPGYAGVPKQFKARLAARVMAGDMTVSGAKVLLNDEARRTGEFQDVAGKARGEGTTAARKAQGLPDAGTDRAERRSAAIAKIDALRTRDSVAAQRAAFDEIENEWKAYRTSPYANAEPDFSAFDPRDIQAFAATRNPQGLLRTALEKGLEGKGYTLAGQAPPGGAPSSEPPAPSVQAAGPNRSGWEAWKAANPNASPEVRKRMADHYAKGGQ